MSVMDSTQRFERCRKGSNPLLGTMWCIKVIGRSHKAIFVWFESTHHNQLLARGFVAVKMQEGVPVILQDDLAEEVRD